MCIHYLWFFSVSISFRSMLLQCWLLYIVFFRAFFCGSLWFIKLFSQSFTMPTKEVWNRSEACLKQSEKTPKSRIYWPWWILWFFDDAFAILLTTYDYIIMLLESLWGLWTQICTIMVAQDKSMKAVRVLPSQEMQRRERIQKGFRFGNRFSLIFAIVCCSLLSYFVRQHAVIFTITWSIGICSFNIMNYHGLIFLIISNISFDVFLSRSRLFFCQHLSYDVF